MDTATAQRWLATELILASLIRTVTVIRDNDAIPGPSVYVPIGIAYGILALFADFRTTAKASAYLGGVIVMTMLLRPVSRTDKGTGQSTPTTQGAEVLQSFGALSHSISTSPPALGSPPGQ